MSVVVAPPYEAWSGQRHVAPKTRDRRALCRDSPVRDARVVDAERHNARPSLHGWAVDLDWQWMCGQALVALASAALRRISSRRPTHLGERGVHDRVVVIRRRIAHHDRADPVPPDRHAGSSRTRRRRRGAPRSPWTVPCRGRNHPIPTSILRPSATMVTASPALRWSRQDACSVEVAVAQVCAQEPGGVGRRTDEAAWHRWGRASSIVTVQR